MKVLVIFIALLAQLGPAGCKRETSQKSSSGEPTPPIATDVKREREELTAIEIHKVKLDYPHKLRDADGKERIYEEAWLVLLFIKNLGPERNTGTDLSIGDYVVPEFGSFKDGIYFRIYEESLLQSLEGKEISMALTRKKMQPLGKKFSIAGYKNLSIEEESALLKR